MNILKQKLQFCFFDHVAQPWSICVCFLKVQCVELSQLLKKGGPGMQTGRVSVPQ